jgi:hypothetical protein
MINVNAELKLLPTYLAQGIVIVMSVPSFRCTRILLEPDTLLCRCCIFPLRTKELVVPSANFKRRVLVHSNAWITLQNRGKGSTMHSRDGTTNISLAFVFICLTFFTPGTICFAYSPYARSRSTAPILSELLDIYPLQRTDGRPS